jgi:bifunctional DNA-binding transcriptional regulator/antitoxin component of YhaV-PrlF toxin-antitoxin module
MRAVIDKAGRVVLPRSIRDALGLLPPTTVGISPYGAGAQIVPTGWTERLAEENGRLVAISDTVVTDDMVFALIDAGRTRPSRRHQRRRSLILRSHPGHASVMEWWETLSHPGIAGGAVYDAMVALAAREHGAPLATRGARARTAYDVVGVELIVVA